MTSYYERVTEGSWAAALPVKTLRWAIAVGVGAALGGIGVNGLAISAISAGLGAADMFLVERLAAGWRPNQFVEGKLRSFAKTALP